MKTAFVSAAVLIAAAAYSSAADCDMAKIEGLLYPNATQGLADCENATGIDIFAVGQFPTTEQVTQLSRNVDCADYLNQINQVANAEIQCNVTIEGVPVNFGKLIADFLTGKTGNESDSGSGSIEIPSESASGSVGSGSANLDSSATNSGSTAASDSSGSSGASSAQAFSFIAYGIAAVAAMALQ
ncbi:Elicitin [Phytophthora infestans]|nr:Elicitin [Phytophthora infestans]